MIEKLDEPIDVLVKFCVREDHNDTISYLPFDNFNPKEEVDKSSKKNFDNKNKFKITVVPTYFKWRNKTYAIEKINLVHRERMGNDTMYYFSVSDNANYFRLAFFTGDLSWRIEELFYEG